MSIRFCTLALSFCFIFGILSCAAEAQDCDSCKFAYDKNQHVYILTEPCSKPGCYCPIPVVAGDLEEDPGTREITCLKSTGTLQANEVLVTLCQPDGSVTHAMILQMDPTNWVPLGSFKVIGLQAKSPAGAVEWEIQIMYSSLGEFSNQSATTTTTATGMVFGQSHLQFNGGKFIGCMHYDDAKTNTFQFLKHYQISITRK